MARHTGFDDETSGIILARSQGSCEVMATGCVQVPSEIHHRRPRGMGGTRRADTNRASNGLVVCRICHDRIESRRTWATLNGFLVIQGEDPAGVPVWWRCGHERRRAGRWVKRWLMLDDTGLLVPVAHTPEEVTA